MCLATLSYSNRPAALVWCVCQYTRVMPAALATRGWIGEQVLPATGELDAGGVSVKQVVGQPQPLPIKLCRQCKNRFGRVEEALPGDFRDLGRQRGGAVAPWRP